MSEEATQEEIMEAFQRIGEAANQMGMLAIEVKKLGEAIEALASAAAILREGP